MRACFGMPSRALTHSCRWIMSAARLFRVAVGRVLSTWPFCIRKGILPPRGRCWIALDFRSKAGRRHSLRIGLCAWGSLKHNGRRFQIHAHVVAVGSDEHGELVWFRERLRGDPLLRQRYEERKRAILANGISDSLEYCHAKGEFITGVLKDRDHCRLTPNQTMKPTARTPHDCNRICHDTLPWLISLS